MENRPSGQMPPGFQRPPRRPGSGQAAQGSGAGQAAGAGSGRPGAARGAPRSAQPRAGQGQARSGTQQIPPSATRTGARQGPQSTARAAGRPGQGGAPRPPQGAAARQGQGNVQRPPRKRRKKRPLSPEEARRRRIRRGITVGAFAAVLIVAAFSISAAVLFKIKAITVNTPDGELPYEESQILAAFGHTVGENLFGFGLEGAQENIAKALPYLENVSIERRLPDTVVITASPAVEQCAVESTYGWAVCSEREKVLRIEAQPPEGLIRVDGARADSPLPGQPLKLTEEDKQPILRALLKKTAAQGLVPINEIDLTSMLEISILYQDRIRIVLGTENEMDYKLDWAWRMVTPGQTDDSLGDAERGTLDVSSRGEDGLGRARWRAGVL